MSKSPEKANPSAALCYGELASFSDEVLMVRLREGHHDALAVLFDRYHRLVLNVALRILRDSGEAEDLMQSVFLEIFRSAAQFDAARGTTKVWILQYAYHRSFNRRQYLNLRGLYEVKEELTQAQSTPDLANTRSLGVLESAQPVQQTLGQLSKAQRKVLEVYERNVDWFDFWLNGQESGDPAKAQQYAR
jgi:RNA polymerase sigma-70 factor (ECF subfamily)